MHFPLDFSLDTEFFFRANRQYIIHYSSISKIYVLSKSRIQIKLKPEPKNGLMVGSARTPEFRKWLDR